MRHDPVGFLEALEPQVAIDRSETRGQYLLTGSTTFLTTRTLSETLTGRIGLVELLSVGDRLVAVPVSDLWA